MYISTLVSVLCYVDMYLNRIFYAIKNVHKSFHKMSKFRINCLHKVLYTMCGFDPLNLMNSINFCGFLP